jgi:hypothetical protein
MSASSRNPVLKLTDGFEFLPTHTGPRKTVCFVDYDTFELGPKHCKLAIYPPHLLTRIETLFPGIDVTAYVDPTVLYSWDPRDTVEPGMQNVLAAGMDEGGDLIAQKTLAIADFLHRTTHTPATSPDELSLLILVIPTGEENTVLLDFYCDEIEQATAQGWEVVVLSWIIPVKSPLAKMQNVHRGNLIRFAAELQPSSVDAIQFRTRAPRTTDKGDALHRGMSAMHI